MILFNITMLQIIQYYYLKSFSDLKNLYITRIVIFLLLFLNALFQVISFS